MKLILLGAVGKAHGLRGEVQVIPFNPGSSHWRPGATLHLLRPGDPGYPESRTMDIVESPTSERRRIDRIREGADRRLILSFDGVTTRREAERLRGAVLGVTDQELGTLEEGEYWYHEVPGWEVVTSQGDSVGHVVRALSTHIEFLEVRPSSGGETFYLPVLPHVVTSIDREARRVTVDPPDGLLP